MGVLARELSGEGREYELKVPPILKIPRTEEGGPKVTVCEQSLRDRLRDGALPRSGQPIQPIDGALVEVPCPEFDGIQDSSTCPLEATFAFAVSKLGPLCTTEAIQDSRNGCQVSSQNSNRLEQRMS